MFVVLCSEIKRSKVKRREEEEKARSLSELPVDGYQTRRIVSKFSVDYKSQMLFDFPAMSTHRATLVFASSN